MFEVMYIAIAITIAGVIVGLFLKGIDRKLAAYLQSRIGPPIAQPLYDVMKLMHKQTIVPSTSVRWLFNGAPFVALVSCIVLFLYITLPYMFYIMGMHSPLHGDLIVVIYLVLIPSIAVISGAFASGSPYASIGAQREMVLLMSTELPIAVVVVSIAWHVADSLYNPFALQSFLEYTVWHKAGAFGILGSILLLLAMMLVLPAEMSKVPFDQAEAETEIAEGVLVEYSGKLLAFLLLTDAFKALSLSILIIILFFPYTISSLFGISFTIGNYTITPLVEILFLVFKIIIVYSFGVTIIRVIMARLKISQVAKVFLFAISAISIIGMVLIMLDPKMKMM
ncbi:MAG: NADH-quinone oxidoreductase subunit H [Spirochaetes bacterium]|nr:NADH-quinone oxidoreductase subunit H [Spirochaetota bacterium]